MLERVAGAEIFCYVALITDVAREHSAEKNIIDKSLIFFFLWDKQFALFLNLSTYYQLKREKAGTSILGRCKTCSGTRPYKIEQNMWEIVTVVHWKL